MSLSNLREKVRILIPVSLLCDSKSNIFQVWAKKKNTEAIILVTVDYSINRENIPQIIVKSNYSKTFSPKLVSF